MSDKEAVIDEAQEFVQSQMKKTEDTVSTEDQEDVEDQPIIKFVNNMIAEAVRQRVSDIHLEPQEKKLVIRFRVDGKLIKYMDSSKELAPSVTSRIKFISGMNIAEKEFRRTVEFTILSIIKKLICVYLLFLVFMAKKS